MNSIWHTAAETPKAERYFIEHYKVVVGDKVYWKYGLFKGVSDYNYPFDQDTARWCYLDDLLALETELERHTQALDVAVDALKIYSSKVGNWLYGEFQGDYDEDPGEIADKALEQITALKQKDIK